MITTRDLRERITRQPFEPFRIVTSSGESYEVVHPDFLLLGTGWVIVGMPSSKDPDLAERDVKVSLLHVTALEKLPAASKAKKNGKK